MASPVTIRWVKQPELSAAHSAYIVATGAPCVDQKTEQLLVSPVTGINTRLISSSIDIGMFWQRYRSGIIANDDSNRACAKALLSAGCSEFQVEQTAKAISSLLSECRLSFSRRFPKLGDQLELRARPLKQHWEMVGPGLLGNIQRQVWGDSLPDDWWPTRVDGLLVQPMRGGDGGYDTLAGKFWIEAMLTDVDPAVPEVLRVAWLVTQLAIESHFRDKSGDQTLARAWSLASVPLVLTAAAQLDLIQGEKLPIRAAIDLWHLGGEEVSGKLELWWQRTQDAPTPLPVALKEFDRMLHGAGGPAKSRS